MLRQPFSIATLAAVLAPFLALGTVSGNVLYSRQAHAQSLNQTTLAQTPAVPAGTTVRIDGSTSMTGISQTLKQKFESQFPDTQVDLTQNGTAAALQDLQDGKIDLAAIGRPLTDQEKAAGLVQTPITRRKIAVVVGEQNPFPGDMTGEQFAAIFRGEIVNWSEIGGPNKAIRVIDRVTTDTRVALQPYPVFQAGPFQTGRTGAPIEDEATEEMVKQLGDDGISYAIVDQVTNRPGVKIVSLYGTLPTDPNYPFSQPLTYVFKGPNPNPAVQAFLGYATTPDNQQAVATAPSGTGADAPNTAAPGAVPVPIPASPAPASPAPADPNAAAPGADPNASPAPASLGTTAPETTAQAPAADAGASRGGIPLWLWILSLPLLGGLIWALLKGLGADDEDEVAGAAGPDAAGAGAVGAGAVGAGAIGAGALLAGDREGDNSRIVLTARNANEAYAYWEVPEAHKQRVRKEEGGQKLSMRLYDVTGLEFDRHPAHSIEEFDCDETDQDLHIPIPQTDRDYLVELGYVTYQGRWVKLAQSNPVHIAADGTATTAQAKASPDPAPTLPMMPTLPNLDDSMRAGGVSLIDPPSSRDLDTSESDTSDTSGRELFEAPTNFNQNDFEEDKSNAGENLGAGAAGAIAGGVGLGAAFGTAGLDMDRAEANPATTNTDKPSIDSSRSRVKRSQIVLVPRNSQEAYAYWDVLEHHKEIAKQHGGQNFILRICDVTGVDPEQQAPHSIQQFNCEETDRDRHVTVPDLGEYVAEIGYLAKNGRWLRIARSAPVHIPPVDDPLTDSLPFS